MSVFQLTHASTEAGRAGSGGWDVQRVSPGVPAPLEAQMRAGVTTRLETLDRLSDFPTSAELTRRTRRMSFRFEDDGGSVWWHAVDAGADATGRSGNVFTHSVAMAGLPSVLRPVDLWRSRSWLVPYGQREVLDADLPEFDLAGPLGRDAALDRALGRQEETEALLSAVTTCLRHGWSLVLASASQDEFAAWLSVVSHLTATEVAAGKLSFSTFDRVARLKQAVEYAVVVGMPAEDLEQLRASIHDPNVSRTLVLDLDHLPTPPPGEHWEYEGQCWPVAGLWQEAFFELTDTARYTRAAVTSILATMDEQAVGHEFPDPGLPLAAALLQHADPDERARLHLHWQERLSLDDFARLTAYGPAPDEPHAAPVPAPVPEAEPDPEPEPEPGPDPVTVGLTLPSPAAATDAHRRVVAYLMTQTAVLDAATINVLDRWVRSYDRTPPHPDLPRGHLTDGADRG